MRPTFFQKVCTPASRPPLIIMTPPWLPCQLILFGRTRVSTNHRHGCLQRLLDLTDLSLHYVDSHRIGRSPCLVPASKASHSQGRRSHRRKTMPVCMSEVRVNIAIRRHSRVDHELRSSGKSSRRDHPISRCKTPGVLPSNQIGRLG